MGVIIIFNIFKKVSCSNCNKEFRKSKVINYAGEWICSEECMCKFFKGLSYEKLVELEKLDKEINPRYNIWAK